MPRKLRVGLILGTRPEIIKLSPLIRLLKKNRADFFLIHSGQHYSFEMDRLFFKELDLPAPEEKLGIRADQVLGHAGHVGRMMTAIERILLKRRPGVVYVQGDTNTVLAGALAASKIAGVRIGHVEAGLRSYDRAMPEEINRMMADHVSDFLFTPTTGAKKILLGEGISPKKIFVTGNTIVDAVYQNLKVAQRKIRLQTKTPFMLLTLHRQENVDSPLRLGRIMQGLERVARKTTLPILFPMHPRTGKNLKRFRIRLAKGLGVQKPAGFLEFLKMENEAKLILTDSGGVQEEACILHVPCVTLRTSTERPETLAGGANRLVGYDPGRIASAALAALQQKRNWTNPFGDGHASERILRSSGVLS